MSISEISWYPVTISSTCKELFVVFVHDCGVDVAANQLHLAGFMVGFAKRPPSFHLPRCLSPSAMLLAEESHGVHSQGRSMTQLKKFCEYNLLLGDSWSLNLAPPSFSSLSFLFQIPSPFSPARPWWLVITMLTLLILSSLLAVIAQTAASNSSTAATFVFNSLSTDQTFVFALNSVQSTGDLFFHLEAPAGQAWAAVGIGSEMKDALIFAAYASENGTGVTISPRIATRHSEPAYSKGIKLEQLWPSDFNNSNTVGIDGRLRADAVCRNCTSWLSGQRQLDLKSTSAPFIFAIGPEKTMRSSSLTASMRRHGYYGHFTINMTAATTLAQGSIPLPNSQNGTYRLQGASETKNMTSDSSVAPAAHALIMIAAFVFLFPLGSLLLRVLHKALWHGAVQVLALLMILIGFALGIYVSTQYNKVCHLYCKTDPQ
jgi:hypothetical protein